MNANPAAATDGSLFGTDDHKCDDDDPLLESRRRQPNNVVRDGDYVLLHFGDGKQVFCQCCLNGVGKKTTVRINKRNYSTSSLVGLPYGTVLEQEQSKLVALPADAKLIPEFPTVKDGNGDGAAVNDDETMETNNDKNNSTDPMGEATVSSLKDNRSLVDTNTAQQLDQNELIRMRDQGVHGATIVASIIENSSTYHSKTSYSQAKYVVRKQKKYQPRCRIVCCNAATISQALYCKEPKKVMNLRDDSLAQILSYANVYAGCRVLVVETCLGIVTGALAQRMGGYGTVLSVYTGQQPSFTDVIAKYNLSFAENASIAWIHAGDVFGASSTAVNESSDITVDLLETDTERLERQALEWPCPLQDHTRRYIQTELVTDKKVTEFLHKRAARFCRKLCRLTPTEAAHVLHYGSHDGATTTNSSTATTGTSNSSSSTTRRLCDSVILAAARYNPTETLLQLWPYLAPSCPFVVFSEFIEPLTACFKHLQQHDLAINLRLSTTWMREYQVLPNRTHPSMNMSQSGGFILTGILLPESGRHQLDEAVLQQIKATIGGRRSRKNKKAPSSTATTGAGTTATTTPTPESDLDSKQKKPRL